MRAALLAGLLAAGCAAPAPLVLVRDDEAQHVAVRVGERELVGWCQGAELALPHWFPLRSPSGKELLVEHPDPYPHHRAMWIADKVQLGDGPIVDFYHCTKNQIDPGDAGKGYWHAIRAAAPPRARLRDGRAELEVDLQWRIGEQPVLDDHRTLVVTPLPDGELLLDLEWTLRAAHGPVTFHSDAVHYAWPYLRLHPQFSVAAGGALVDDQGRRGQAATDGQPAAWIDCSNTVDNVTEGVAVFAPPGGRRRWLTRDYGCFGPRRDDAHNGTRFTLAAGAELGDRVRIFVHRGDAAGGRVAARYRDFVEGR